MKIKARRALNFMACGPGARLRTPVGFKGKASGRGAGGEGLEAPGFYSFLMYTYKKNNDLAYPHPLIKR